jgi:hypothetical protein
MQHQALVDAALRVGSMKSSRQDLDFIESLPRKVKKIQAFLYIHSLRFNFIIESLLAKAAPWGR